MWLSKWWLHAPLPETWSFLMMYNWLIISVVDFCDKNPSPCQNGGMCHSDLQNNWYSCVCSQGYHGKTHYSLSWLSDMCKLLKVFRSSFINVFLCVSGYHCEDRYNVCDRGPCLNGGTCSVQNNSPVCLCPTGQLLHPHPPITKCNSMKDRSLH